MCFWSFWWSWQKDVNMRLRICFVSRKWHVNKEHSDKSRDIIFCYLSVCGKSGWALGLIDLVYVDGFLFLKDDVLDLDPGRSRGFEGKVTFRTMQLVANSVKIKILMVSSDSLSTNFPRIVKNAKSACTLVSNEFSRRRRQWKVDLLRAQMVHLGS